jgi:molybdate transport system substrate-binding protein
MFYRPCLLLFWLILSQLAHAEPITIAAASNLRFVLPELIASYSEQSKHKVNTSYAASGTLTSQIQHGAPFDIFMSANPDYISRLNGKGYIQSNTIVNYAKAQFALFKRTDSGILLSEDLHDIQNAISEGRLDKVVIANPNHAPYGKLAKTVLQQHGLWQQVQTHLLIAENASQSLQFSLSPQASIGFIPYTYVLQESIAKQGQSLKLAETLQQQAALVITAHSSAHDFLVFLSSDKAKAILTKQGFEVE